MGMLIDQPELSRRAALALLFATAGAVALASGAQAQTPQQAPAWTPPEPDRELMVPVRGGRVWVRVNGDLNGPRAPVLMAHGGPGGNHVAFAPGLKFASERAVILYDQLDCGRSDHPQSRANWTVERFVSEVDAIRAALGLQQLHLLGHSWGGTIALEYAGRQPAGLKSVILQGPLISTKSWIADANALVQSMAPAERDALIEGERTGNRSSPAYRAATVSFYRQFNGRERPPAYIRAYAQRQPRTPSTLYDDMWGPTEFSATGLLKDYDGEWLLERIDAPALFLCGEYDEARPSTVESFSRRAPRGEFRMIPGAAHGIQYDREQAWLDAVGQWLRRHD
jgi:proline iminopeptidase/L-proline amide hydrolase